MMSQPESVSQFPKSKIAITLSRNTKIKIGIICIPFLLFLIFWNLPNYPVISGWDEGVYLEFARNWTQYGELATRNGTTFERLYPNLSVGPTLILPLGIGLSLTQYSLVGARLVAALYLLAAVAGVYALVKRVFGEFAAIISIFLFLMAGHTTFDTLWTGRQGIGEIPALVFLVWGLWAWIKSWHKGMGYLFLSTLLITLAVITKAQIIIVLVPSLGAILVIDRIYYHKLRWVHTVLPLVGTIASYGIWWVIITPQLIDADHRQLYLDVQSLVTNAAFLHVSLNRWIENLKFLFKSEQWLILFVGIIYGLWRSRERSLESLQTIVLPVFAGASLVTYIFVSLPWPRYLYLTLALGAFCMALVIQDFVLWANTRWKLKFRPVQAVILLGVVFAVFIGPRLVRNVGDIVTAQDTSAQEFAKLVDQTVPPNTAILNWEWEIEFYSTSTFIHPPYLLFPALIDQVYNQQYHPILDEPRIPDGVKYLIVGPFAKQVQVFTSELETKSQSPIFSVGPYDLYQLAT